MSELCGKERIARILQHKSVDRIGLYEHFWKDTRDFWVEKGYLASAAEAADRFHYDLGEHWASHYTLDPNFVDEVVEETEDTRVIRNGNGALLRQYKHHTTTPEHVGYAINNREQWNAVRERLVPMPGRLDVEGYRRERERCERAGRFFCHAGVNVFEAIHPLVGHENMLLGMGLDPEWIAEMATVYAELMINLMEELFSVAGKPDGVWFYEDMGFKGRPFMSPDMYRELIQPAHRRTVDFAHALGLPVIMHSCGFIEPLLPGMVEAGIDCLQVIEIKAGMDLLKIKREYGDRLALCGGIDTRNLVANDLDAIDRELAEKLPEVMKGSGYILHSDHSIPIQCEFSTYCHFVEEGMRLGVYAG